MTAPNASSQVLNAQAMESLAGEIGHLTFLTSTLRVEISQIVEQIALLAAVVSDMHLVLVPAS